MYSNQLRQLVCRRIALRRNSRPRKGWIVAFVLRSPSRLVACRSQHQLLHNPSYVTVTESAVSQSVVSSASVAIESATSSAPVVLSSITSSIAADPSAAVASPTKANAAGVAAQLPSLNIVTAVAGAFLATALGPTTLFA
ncbi:hypothetical protein FRB95_010369 [Tulasnella sp. JGI-2019a]|nr:hypothetical protein FRB95_010369 [Tulasnella sp. JGI-2019a]